MLGRILVLDEFAPTWAMDRDIDPCRFGTDNLDLYGHLKEPPKKDRTAEVSQKNSYRYRSFLYL